MVIDSGIKSGGRYFCLYPYRGSEKSTAKIFRVVSKRLIEIGKNKAPAASIELRAGVSRQAYIKNLFEFKKEIQRGNIYEINYCIEFFAETAEIDPLNVFIKLYELTKAPYSRLLRMGDEYIISASPELFLKREDGTLITKPIKGTVRRGENKEHDEQLKKYLHENVKERTENVMAVDVARNDLSRIAERGSVTVNKLYNIETFETVHQMVSTVSCVIKDNASLDEIIAATFPMASMTGAPKVKAMQLIDKNENFKRNYYSGAMGFVEENGDFELSVNIRSIFYNSKSKRLSIAVGSAITHLCDPEQEYEECLLKANALLKALNATIKGS